MIHAVLRIIIATYWENLFTLSLCYTVKCKVDDNSYILKQYNRVICNKYVTPSSYCEEDYDQVQVVSPNICKWL